MHKNRILIFFVKKICQIVVRFALLSWIVNVIWRVFSPFVKFGNFDFFFGKKNRQIKVRIINKLWRAFCAKMAKIIPVSGGSRQELRTLVRFGLAKIVNFPVRSSFTIVEPDPRGGFLDARLMLLVRQELLTILAAGRGRQLFTIDWLLLHWEELFQFHLSRQKLLSFGHESSCTERDSSNFISHVKKCPFGHESAAGFEGFTVVLAAAVSRSNHSWLLAWHLFVGNRSVSLLSLKVQQAVTRTLTLINWKIPKIFEDFKLICFLKQNFLEGTGTKAAWRAKASLLSWCRAVLMGHKIFAQF